MFGYILGVDYCNYNLSRINTCGRHLLPSGNLVYSFLALFRLHSRWVLYNYIPSKLAFLPKFEGQIIHSSNCLSRH